MNYVISDIHGCYEQYMKLLDKIHFSERDTLYLLGDLVDRGPEPMEVVKDVMRRKNVVTIMGNHDYRALRILERFDIGADLQILDQRRRKVNGTGILKYEPS